MIPETQLVHVASIEPFEGAGSAGDVYGAPFSVKCYYEGKRQLVRDSAGEEAVSEGTFYANVVDIAEDSRVTVAGRTTYVLSVALLNDGQGLDHVEVALA